MRDMLRVLYLKRWLLRFVVGTLGRRSKRMIVYRNGMGAVGILCSCAVYVIARVLLPSSAAGIAVSVAGAFAFLGAWAVMMRPELMIQFLVCILLNTIYKLTVVGRKNIPLDSGALLVSNTASYIDHALVLAALPRPVRFFMGREYYEHPLINPLARAAKAIPISNTDNPKTTGRALQEARNAIKNGELVCIFAEGAVTRTGNMLPFGRGLEFIMRGLNAPIVPMHLDRIWGSTFSMVNGKMAWRLPKMLPYPITITFGKRMPGAARVHDVRLAVQELSAEAFNLRGDSQKKLHVNFLYEAKRHPFKFCMADSLGVNLTYGKTLAGMLVFSARLFPGTEDLQPEEKVGVFLPTSGASVLVNGAVMMAGKIPVNLNYTASREILESCVRQCGMKRIITSRAFLEKLSFAPLPGMIFAEDVKAEVSALEQLVTFLKVLVLPAALIKRFCFRGDTSSINDVATIIFSSGSTGEPKGVMLTHRNISSNIEGIYQIFSLVPEDILMSILPFFHSFGYTANMWFPLMAGIGMVLHPNPLDSVSIGEMVHLHKASILMGTPTFMLNYTRRCSKEQFASLRFVVVGAEKLKRSVAEEFYQKFGVPPFEGYGTTELSPIVSLGIPSYIHPQGKFVQVGNKPGTVGHPIPGVAAMTVNPDTFEPLPTGGEGLLLIKGPNVMKGYLNNPGKTAEVIRGGWYVTGDIAMIDEDGFIAITDRLSRFSKIGGEMVPHIKIEEMIQSILEKTDAACVVTSVPDRRKGEKVVVLCKGDVDTGLLWSRLNQSSLPKLWVPKKECFYNVENIPLLGSGKLDLKKIKALAQECLLAAGLPD